MDGEQYLRDLVEQRLAAIRGLEPDATALYLFELKGAANALVSADLLDPLTVNDILDEWHGTLEAEGFEQREAVGFGFHVEVGANTSDAVSPSDRPDEPDRLIRADAIDAHVMDVDGIRLVADGLIRFTGGFDLRVMFLDGSPSARAQLFERMTQRHWEWRVVDSNGTAFRETEGHGGLGAYTLRFRPALPDEARELSLTVAEDSQTVAHVSFTIPTRDE